MEEFNEEEYNEPEFSSEDENEEEEEENTPTNEKLKEGFNPFPGLRPFKIEESHLFFGREGQSDEVLLKLSKNRFVGVIGPSGSGKSSFVYCGVLPILYGGFLTDVSADWEVVVTRPGAGPIENLAESLLRTDKEYRESDEDERKVKRQIFSTLLRSSSLGLVEAIKQFKRSTKKNYLVLVDQFEELFRFKESRDKGAVDETLAFINLLLEAVDNQDVPCYVAITMRSDFIGECAQFADLTKKINDSHYLIPQMTREQKRKAIEGPVAVGGAEITTRLVQRLLNDLGDNPDQLPILQHSLMRTWDYWDKFKDFEDESVDIKHYEAIGTMSEALSLHANEAYDELDDEQKRICESMFKAITEKRGENFGIRRPTRLGDIAAIANASAKDVAAVIEKFREPGRSLLVPAHGITLSPKSVIDISHESLMRIWVRLKNWVDDEADAVQMYIRLAEAASMYQLGKAGLWRPPDLQLALNWESKHRPTLIWAQRYHPAFERTMEFLSHSKREYETEQRIKELQAKRRLKTARITAMVMAGLVVVAIGFLIYAFDQQIEAARQAQRAQDSAAAAQVARADAVIQRDSAILAKNEADIQRSKADSASLKAIAEAQRADSAATEALIAKDTAEYQRQLAIKSAALARLNETKAVLAKEEADSAKFVAEENFTVAQQRLYVSNAKTIALKSLSFSGELFRDIKSLLAQQAYNFNSRFGGYSYEVDVFKGLYYALRANGDPIAATNNNVYPTPGDILMESNSNNRTVFSIHENGRIFSWVDNQKNMVTDSIPGVTVKAASLSSDNRYMALGGKGFSGAYLAIVDLNTKSIQELEELGDGVIDLDYAPNNNLYLLDDHGYTINRVTGNSITEVIKSDDKLTEIVVSHDGQFLYGVSTLGNLHQWNIKKNYEDHPNDYRTTNRIESLEISDNGRWVAFGDSKGILYMIDSQGNMENLFGHEAPITSITFSYDGNFMATSSRDRTVRLWNLNDINKDPIVMDDHNGAVSDMIFMYDNSRVYAGTHNRQVKVWPTDIDQMGNRLCQYVTRNIEEDEWSRYLDPNIPYEKTCENVQEQLSGGED